ncbi:MAG: citramalate synthase [Anaerolineae bacterium]
MHLHLYDTTLRDGTQREGISFSVEDKLKIARKLDELGIAYIEGGWPGSNPKDAEFLARARQVPWQQAIITAFGSTRRAGRAAENDPNLRALLAAGTEVVTLVGKSWDVHVTRVLRTTLEENLQMIADSIHFLKSQGRRVFYDAEHFFDGYHANAPYALQTLRAAAQAGAEVLVLCDTNGGRLPTEIAATVKAVRRVIHLPLGIHAHNDGDLAVANSLAAVQAGVVQVQGTINGYGERCGNANLCSLIPNLQLKLSQAILSPAQLALLTEVSHYVSEVANRPPDPYLPYVGHSAFAHKGGIHADAMNKYPKSYQHVDPALVGNHQRIVVSELAGKGNILAKAKELGLDITDERARVQRILEEIKTLESRGFQFEGAEGSVELLIRRAQPGYQPPFELIDFCVLVESRGGGEVIAEASVKLRVGDEVIHTVAEGNGPVNALDLAVRKALLPFYPMLADTHLSDYKVRILDGEAGTAAQVRVLIDSVCDGQTWSTVGSSTNIIEASWQALADSFEYAFLNFSGQRRSGKNAYR